MGRVVAPLLLVLALAGCGGADGPAAGEAAAVAPASAHAFAVVRTDGDDEQVRRAVELLSRVPAVASLDVDLEGELLPALCDEAALVVLPGGERVWLARPDDPGRLRELLGRLREPPVTGEVDGWTAVARDEDTLEAFRRAREDGALADEESFREAFADLPGDALAHVWTSAAAKEPLRGLALAVLAAEDGFELEGHRPARGQPKPYRPSLLDRVPAGATVVASFHGHEGLADRLKLLPMLAALDREELRDVVAGEGVLVVRPAALVPELTLLAEVEDDAAGTRAAEALLEGLGAVPQGPGGAQFGPLTIHYGARDGVLAVTTSPARLGVLEPVDGGVAADPAFERAAERAGHGEETTGFLYLRADELAPMLGVLSVLGGDPPPPELRENLAALGSVLLHGTRDGDRHAVRAFVEVPAR
jgi:hypothetical protein